MTTTPLASIGIDIGKEVFHVVGFGTDGKIAFRRKFKREHGDHRATQNQRETSKQDFWQRSGLGVVRTRMSVPGR